MTNSPTIPAALADRFTGARFTRQTSGTRSSVWRATFEDDRPDLALKTAIDANDGTPAQREESRMLIGQEIDRLTWLATHMTHPGLGFPTREAVDDSHGPRPVLVTRWLEGKTDPRLLRSPSHAMDVIGRSLASLHESTRHVDLGTCPFDSSMDALLHRCEQRVAAGLVDTKSLRDPFDHFTPNELLTRAQLLASRTRPMEDADRVLVHGDLCISNIIFDPQYSTVVGAVDWTHAGVGDRHFDLAVTARSMARNFSGEVLPDLFAAYGLDEPDLVRIEAYALIEELL